MQTFLQKLHHVLFVGNTPYKDHHEYRRLWLVNALLLITSIVLLIFAVLNAVSFDEKLVAAIDFVAALITLYAYIDLRISKNIDKSIYLASIALFVFFLSLAYIHQNKDFVLIWTIFFPIFVMTLLGHKKGLAITSLFYAVLFIMAYQGIGIWQDGLWNLKSFSRLVIASMVLTYILYVKEAALAVAIEKQKKALDELHLLSITDSLTGLYNRRHMNQQLEQKIQTQQQTNTPLCLAMLDIDNFKQINDQHGHNFGDTVIKEVATSLKEQLTNQHIIARWGGEEFLILFECDITEAIEICEKLRQKVFNQTIERPLNISVSVGVAQYRTGSEQNTVIARADDALYQAKKSGKNCVIQSDF